MSPEIAVFAGNRIVFRTASALILVSGACLTWLMKTATKSSCENCLLPVRLSDVQCPAICLSPFSASRLLVMHDAAVKLLSE